jgi:biopolymer transport protein ExbD
MNLGKDSGSSGEVDLNLAPILDCLTVLVAFLLASASFLSLSALETGVAAASPERAAEQEPPTALFARLAADGSFLAHFEKEAPQRTPNAEGLVRLLQLKTAKNKVLILSVEPTVPVQKVVETLDQWRRFKTSAPVTLATD